MPIILIFFTFYNKKVVCIGFLIELKLNKSVSSTSDMSKTSLIARFKFSLEAKVSGNLEISSYSIKSGKVK